MTIRELKKIIKDYPDDARIYLDDGEGLFEGNSEVVCVFRGVVVYPKKVILQIKDNIDVGAEIEGTLDYYREEGYDELDAFLELGERGYTLEDFRETDHYEMAKEFTKTHAWEGEQL